MTPKNKAQELVEKHGKLMFGEFWGPGLMKGITPHAKKLLLGGALIAVDEILSFTPEQIPEQRGTTDNPKYIFWIEVKKEIKAL